jgi:lipopolysaccharide transport system ATP-binding protein
MASLPILEVEGLSKRYSRDLRRSLRYGSQDILSEFRLRRPRSDSFTLRPDEFLALDDVSFTLGRGESLAVIGANGAGKSTLLKLLHGLLKPDAGQITVRGRLAALIELGTGFDPVLTGRENIEVTGSMLGLSDRRLREATDEIVAFAELEDQIDTPVRYYSTGMSARLSFAVAAHLDPEVLLVDEVLAVGDLAFQRKCIRHIRSFLDRGGSLIFVAHNAFQQQAVCQRGLVLEQGRCTFDGSIEEAISRSLATSDRLEEAIVAAPRPTPDVAHPVVINGIEATGPDGGEPCTGCPLAVTLEYQAIEALDALWGFAIYTFDLYVNVTGAYDSRTHRLDVGEGCLSATVPSLPLMSGQYVIRAHLIDAQTRSALATFGYLEPPHHFRVSSPVSVVNNVSTIQGQMVTLDVAWH